MSSLFFWSLFIFFAVFGGFFTYRLEEGLLTHLYIGRRALLRGARCLAQRAAGHLRLVFAL